MTPGFPGGGRGRIGPNGSPAVNPLRCDHRSATAPSSCKGGRQRVDAILRTHIKKTLESLWLSCYCFAAALDSSITKVADHEFTLLLHHQQEMIYHSASSSARAAAAHPPTPVHITCNMSKNLRSMLAQSFSTVTCDKRCPPRASHLSRPLPRSQSSRRCSPAP